jgi:hypothetical protein
MPEEHILQSDMETFIEQMVIVDNYTCYNLCYYFISKIYKPLVPNPPHNIYLMTELCARKTGQQSLFPPSAPRVVIELEIIAYESSSSSDDESPEL